MKTPKVNVSKYLSIHLMIPTLVLICIPLFFLLVHINNQLISDRVAVMTQTLAVIEHDIDEHQNNLFESYVIVQKVVNSIANDTEKEVFLRTFAEMNSNIVSFFEVDMNGRILSTYPSQPILNGTLLPAWKIRSELNKNMSISRPFKQDISGNVVLFLMPLASQDKNLVMSFSIAMNQYLEHLKDKQIRLFIYEGNQLLVTSSEDMGNQGIGPVLGQYQFKVEENSIVLKDTIYIGRRSVFIELKMKNQPWTIIAITRKNNIFGSQQLIVGAGILISALIGCVYGIFTMGLNKQLIEPLKVLSAYFKHYDVKVEIRKIQEITTESSLVEIEALHNGIKALNLEISNTYQDLYEFASVAAHDLREPLRTIVSYLEILESDFLKDLPDDALSYIIHVNLASKRSQSLIEALLTYTTLNRSLVLETFEMSSTIQQIIESLQLSINQKGARIIVGPLPKIVADKSFFERLMQNLISNSLKYSHQNVVIEVYMAGQFLCVKDNGIGFEPKYTQLIFKPFKRLHTSDINNGAGIGLAMVARIIERQKWHLEVTSEIGKGATFSIDLSGSIVSRSIIKD